jgi:hypothetical protein
MMALLVNVGAGNVFQRVLGMVGKIMSCTGLCVVLWGRDNRFLLILPIFFTIRDGNIATVGDGKGATL